jgi:hypothetical protein
MATPSRGKPMRWRKVKRFEYRKLTWAEQDSVLARHFHLNDEELDCARDFRAFARYDLGIDVHVGQMAFAAKVLLRHPVTQYTAKYLTLLLTSGNRAGKTSLLALIIIYSCLRKLNRPVPTTEQEAGRWLRLEYHWYHFGISQEVADLVFNDIVRILSGTHEGQGGRGCPLANGRTLATWDTKEYGDYRWVKFVAEVGGAEVHFRTTGEKALGSLGKDMHGLSFDEAGLERNLDFLIKEVFGFRRLGTGGQLIMASTPSESLGHAFADNWERGNPEKRDRLESWYSVRMSTRDNVGYGLTKDMFDRLTEDMDERTIKQNVDGYFLQASAAYFNGNNVERVFAHGLPERIPAQKLGVYLQGIDPSKSQDSAWAIVLKVVENAEDPSRPYLVGVNAEEAPGQKSTERVVGLAVNGFNSYERVRLGSRCYTATDATGFGGKMFREALDVEVPNVTNVEFGGTVQKKRKLLGDLRTLIDEGRLILPRTGIWLKVRRQLLGYKLEDRGIEQDAVMALVCAVYLLRIAHTTEARAAAFDMDGTSLYRDETPSPVPMTAAELSATRLRERALHG